MAATATGVATERVWIWPRTAADRLGVDVRTVYRWAADGRIGSRQLGERKMQICAECVRLLRTRGNGAQAQCGCWGEGQE